MASVTFNSGGSLTFNENEPIAITFSYIFTLTPEEILEAEELQEEPNSIISGTISCSPPTDNLNFSFDITNNSFQVNGLVGLDDFVAQITYVDKGMSDKNQVPVIKSKYSEVPPDKDIFRVNPVETSKSFNILLELVDRKNNTYTKDYNINITIKNNSISNWITNYLEGV